MANLRETIRNDKFPTKFQGFPSEKLHYSNGMWFPPSGKHPTLRFTRFRGRETRENSGFPGWKFEETPWKLHVSSKRRKGNHWEITGFPKETQWKLMGNEVSLRELFRKYLEIVRGNTLRSAVSKISNNMETY